MGFHDKHHSNVVVAVVDYYCHYGCYSDDVVRCAMFVNHFLWLLIGWHRHCYRHCFRILHVDQSQADPYNTIALTSLPVYVQPTTLLQHTSFKLCVWFLLRTCTLMLCTRTFSRFALCSFFTGIFCFFCLMNHFCFFFFKRIQFV